jgi:hypothetical protein
MPTVASASRIRPRKAGRRSAEFRIGGEVLAHDRAAQHRVGGDDEKLALHHRDAAVGGKIFRRDFIADDAAVARVDQDLGRRRVKRRGDEAVGRAPSRTGMAGDPQDDFSAAAASRGSALSGRRADRRPAAARPLRGRTTRNGWSGIRSFFSCNISSTWLTTIHPCAMRCSPRKLRTSAAASQGSRPARRGVNRVSSRLVKPEG